MKPKYDILTKRRFLPLFTTQFFGAFNDNLMRNGLITLITFKIISKEALGIDPKILTTIATVLLIAPYIFFSGLAGEMADKYERSSLMRYTKIFEIFVMFAAGYGFYTNNVYLLVGLLFAAGTQATFFSPMKYSVLPDHLHKDELITGNGFIEGGTFLAILLGSILGTQFGNLIDLDKPSTTFYISVSLVCVSLFGIFSSFFIPRATPASPELHVRKNIAASTWEVLKIIHGNRAVFFSIMGTSWFWAIGSIFMSQFPAFGREVLFATPDVYTIFLATFSVGVAIGSVICAKILKGEITMRFAPRALLGLSICTFILLAATHFAYLPAPEVIEKDHLLHSGAFTGDELIAARAFINAHLLTPGEFFSHIANICILIGIFGISFFGGLYTVPLKAMIQTRADEKSRSRVIAGDNIYNSIFMVLAGAVSAGLLALNASVNEIFLIVAVTNLGYALFIKRVAKRIG